MRAPFVDADRALVLIDLRDSRVAESARCCGSRRSSTLSTGTNGFIEPSLSSIFGFVDVQRDAAIRSQT